MSDSRQEKREAAQEKVEELREQMRRHTQAVTYAFVHFYHQDCAHAAVHCSGVRFSPLTFRLAEMLEDMGLDIGQEQFHVLSHRGSYEEDPGR